MKVSTKGMAERPLAFRLLLTCGVIGPLFFIVVFLIEGATRADYNPLRQPVSSLSIGDLGWTQQTNFLITGLLLVAFSIGMWRTLRPSSFWGTLLIGLVGIGLIGAGIFITDPLNGYPPGAPLMPVVRTEHGKLHDLFGVPVFLGLPFACFIFGRWFARLGKRGWAVYSVLSGILMFAFFVLAGMGFSQVPGFADFAGVYQRLSLIFGLGWIALLALHLLKNRASVILQTVPKV
ncbi:MAG TPA: DUF998 domain-containing protein [Anaerolineales bacterium]|nr:DUF998 domain-containing protein [Anaerolineales bacterium]